MGGENVSPTEAQLCNHNAKIPRAGAQQCWEKGRDTQPGEAGCDPTAEKGTWAHGVQKPSNWLAVLWHKLIFFWLTLYHKPRNLRKQGWAWAKHYSILVDYSRPPSYA